MYGVHPEGGNEVADIRQVIQFSDYSNHRLGPAPIEDECRAVSELLGQQRPRERVLRGAPQNPLSWSLLAQKFRDCATLVLDRSRTEPVIGIIGKLDDLPDVRNLVAAFRMDSVHV